MRCEIRACKVGDTDIVHSCALNHIEQVVPGSERVYLTQRDFGGNNRNALVVALQEMTTFFKNL